VRVAGKRNSYIGGGFGSLLSGAWGLYANLTTVKDLPQNADWVAQMIADPPVYAPWLLFAACVFFLAWVFWHRDQPESDNDSQNQTIIGENSANIAGTFNNSTFNFNAKLDFVNDPLFINKIDRTKSFPTLPGYARAAILRFSPQQHGGKSIFFEDGTAQNGRISFYITANKHFNLSVIDTSGEPHIITAYPGVDGVPLGEYIYILLEVGFGYNYTVARISVNGEVVSQGKFEHKIDVGDIDWVTYSVGEGLNGFDHYTFCLRESYLYSCTADDELRQNMAEYASRNLKCDDRRLATHFTKPQER
jgi:hypothetical protein